MSTEIEEVKKGRGRPSIDKDQQQVDQFKANIFTKDFKNADGTVDRWYFDLNRYPRGAYKTEMDIFNKEPMPENKKVVVNQEDLPKTKRQYINPNNGKLVGYTRARMLGLID
jgi:hypothetical protein